MLPLFGLALLAVTAMSAVPVLVKGTAANEVTIGLARLAIAVAIVAPLMFRKQRWRQLSARNYGRLAIIGLVFGLHWLCYFASIKLATASIGAAAVATFGVQYLLLAWWFNGEPFGLPEFAAVIVCLAGCLMITPDLSFQTDLSLGLAVGVFSGFLYACLPLLHQRARHMDSVQRSFGQFLFGLLFFVPLWRYSDWRLQTSDIIALLVLGIVCTAIAHGLWIKVTTELPALFTSLAYYLYVPIAVFSSALLLGESLTASKVTGVAMILAASIAATIHRLRSEKHQRAR